MLRRLLGYTWLGLVKKSSRETYLTWAYLSWAHYALDVFGVELEVQGRDRVPAAGNAPRVFLCNHQSQIDIPVLVAALEEKLGFVAKKELNSVPLLAYWMRQIGCVFIDRSDKSGARKSLEEAAASLGSRSLVVFPEGTRSKSGELLPVKSGGLRMAALAGAEIIPVRIHNSRNVFEARAAGVRGPIPVQVQFFAPMNVRDETNERAAWQKVKVYLEECWASNNSAVSSAR